MKFPKLKPQVRFFVGVICFFSASLVTAIGLHMVLGPVPGPNPRGPASVVYDNEGNELYAEDSVEDLEKAGRTREFRGQGLGIGTVLSQVSDPVSASEATMNTGVKTTRVRKMKFNQDAFLQLAKARASQVQLPLFKDVDLRIQLRPSNYGTNSGVWSGQVVGDPGSRVDIFVGSGDMNATIETQGHRYRILTSGRQAIHYVVEEDLSARR